VRCVRRALPGLLISDPERVIGPPLEHLQRLTR
jgi:hypothetical protein